MFHLPIVVSALPAVAYSVSCVPPPSPPVNKTIWTGELCTWWSFCWSELNPPLLHGGKPPNHLVFVAVYVPLNANSANSWNFLDTGVADGNSLANSVEHCRMWKCSIHVVGNGEWQDCICTVNSFATSLKAENGFSHCVIAVSLRSTAVFTS